VERRARLDLDEFPFVELLPHLRGVVEHLGRNLTGRVLQDQRQEHAAAAAGAQLLPRAEVERPSLG